MSCDPWPLVWPCGTPPADLSEDQQALAVAVAQDILWSLTGRRLGSCTVTENYAAPGSGVCVVPNAPLGLIQSAAGANATIILAKRPVQRVVSVTENGVLLPTTAYRLGHAGRLHRVGGSWPQAREAADAPVQVSYVWGIRLVAENEGDPLPPYAYSAGLAVGELATDIGAGLCGGECHLPSRVLSLSRQGVTFDFQSAADFVDQGLTGMPIADAFIRTVNPNRLTDAPSVVSLDVPGRV